MIRYRIRKLDGTWAHKAERLYGLDGKKAARAVLDQRIRETANPRVSFNHIEGVLHQRAQKVSAKTLLNEIGLLQSIFSLAVDNDLLDRSPVRSRHKPKTARSEKPIWSPTQVKQILAALPEPYRTLFTCAACTGLRAGELLALSWGDINFSENNISIRRSLWGKQVVRPKTDASIRVFCAGPLLMDVLRRHRLHSVHCEPSDWVFCNAQGQPWNADILRRDVLYPVLDRLQVPRPARSSGFHCFRHSAGSFVNSQTGNMKLAQKLLGHSRYETTANVYAHALSGEEREAAMALEEAIFGSCSQLFPNENSKGPKTVN